MYQAKLNMYFIIKVNVKAKRNIVAYFLCLSALYAVRMRNKNYIHTYIIIFQNSSNDKLMKFNMIRLNVMYMYNDAC